MTCAGLKANLHTPLTHLVPHTLPQPPQLFRSVLRSISQPSAAILLQFEKLPLQAPSAHALLLQRAPAFEKLHATPQLPQLAGSFLVSTHAPLHLVVPPTQESAQTPAEQTCPLAQAFPQLPQLAGSFLVSTHDCPQAWLPPVHALPHLPAEQTSPALHAAAQAPQLAPSDCTLTHDCPHCVLPPPQLVAHFPVAQTSPALHAFPQLPQLAGSRASTVHVLPQACALSPQLRPPSTSGAVTAVLPSEQATTVATETKAQASSAPRILESEFVIMAEAYPKNRAPEPPRNSVVSRERARSFL